MTQKIVETILFKVNSQKIKLSQKELELFSKSIKLLDLNSRPINVLTTLLLMLLNREKKILDELYKNKNNGCC